MKITDNAVILFQGDSITDAKHAWSQPEDLGSGFVSMIAALFNSAYPEKNVTFLNRGSSGNRVVDLKGRWQRDCLDIKPDVLSILIGVNDCWRRYEKGDVTTAESFYSDYRHILAAVRDEVNPRLVLCEPFVLPCPADRIQWREDIDDKITAVRALAREFHALLIPLDGIFNAASTQRGPEFWAYDGVHPSPAGIALIARSWLAAVVKED
jgi:acyl-CoA thioesterase I